MERFGKRTEETGIRVEVPEASGQRFVKRSGVVLKRGSYMEGDLALLLFLKTSGMTWCYVPGAVKGSVRFGGALEPLVWGRYQLYQSKRRVYVREVEVTDDHWELRKRPKAIFTAARWIRLLIQNLIPGYPYDSLLVLFYWAVKALEKGVDPDIVNARFLWRWLLDWGIAPDYKLCSSCGRPLNGSGSWYDGGFCCPDCASGLPKVAFQQFAEYALSNSYIPKTESTEIAKQAKNLFSFFVKNLEDNR